MPYELTVAIRKDPSEKGGRPPRQVANIATLVLSGGLDAGAAEAVLATVAQASVEGAHSIAVEFADVHVDDDVALGDLTGGLMALRAAGTEVQIAACASPLYERLLSLPDARDWLMTRASDGSALPRKSMHLDAQNGPSER